MPSVNRAFVSARRCAPLSGSVRRVQGWCNEAWLAYLRLTGCSRLDTAKRERPSRARPVTGMDPAALDGSGHGVSGLGLYTVQAGGQWGTSREGKAGKLSSVMQCGERPSPRARVSHRSRWPWLNVSKHGRLFQQAAQTAALFKPRPVDTVSVSDRESMGISATPM